MQESSDFSTIWYVWETSRPEEFHVPQQSKNDQKPEGNFQSTSLKHKQRLHE